MSNITVHVTEFFSKYYPIIIFYLPLGIIGIWRWGVWAIRKFVALFYRMPRGDFNGTLSIVVPVYNEDPDLLKKAYKSWLDNDPEEIIAVIDYSNKDLIEIWKGFQKDFPGAKLIVTKKQGKRPALADGFRIAKGDIIAFVDSDTVWSPDIKKLLIGPFSDPLLGGLVTRQDVLDTDTFSRKMFKIQLTSRYAVEYPFLAAAGNAILCLSGRTAVYRREAIKDGMEGLENETFMGQKMISGDDKSLTNYIHAHGWHSTFLRDVRVYTTGNPKFWGLVKQQVRWARNGLRSDVKVLTSAWVWKNHKVLAIHMLDKFVQPLTLLLSPIYFLVSLYLGLWQGALIIAIWWLVSRAIKIYPHLKENPLDIFILPLYIPVTFLMAIVKIYAFFTIDKEGWITRWNEKRLRGMNFFHAAVSYISTGALVFLLVFVVFNYKHDDLVARQVARQNSVKSKMTEKQQLSIFTPDKPRMSASDIQKTKAGLIDTVNGDPYGYMVVQQGDTVASLRRRFNLLPTGKLLDAKTKRPISNFAFLTVGQQLAIPVEDLRNPLSRNILSRIPFMKPARINYDIPSNTIFVKQSGSIVTIPMISRAFAVSSRKLIVQTAPGEWLLNANLYIGKNVTLVVDGTDTKYLKLKSDDSGYVWLRSESGDMLFSNTKVTSWDAKNNAPDHSYEKGRAYVTAKNDGRMDIINSEFADLGYSGLPRRGGLFGGSYGVSWKIKSHAIKERLLTGVILNSKFHGNYFGMYTYGATGMLVQGNQAYENIQYGFDPHDDSNNMLIKGNEAFNNGNHGIIISRRCVLNTIVDNVSHDNRLHGIMLDRSSNNNLVENNTVYGDVDGIAIYQSDGNLILNNSIHNNIRGIRMNVGASGNYAEGNNIDSNSRGVYIYDQAHDNLLVNNQIHGSEIGITIKNAFNNSLFDNFKPSDNKKDGRITADAYENNIQ